MKIISDNSELLDQIHNELKIKRIRIEKETKVIEGAMSDELTVAIIIIEQIMESKEEIENIVEIVTGIIVAGKYLKGLITIEKKDGTTISL